MLLSTTIVATTIAGLSRRVKGAVPVHAVARPTAGVKTGPVRVDPRGIARRRVIGIGLVRAAEAMALVAAASCLIAGGRYDSTGYVGLRAGSLCGMVLPNRPGRSSWEWWFRPGPGDRGEVARWGCDYWSSSTGRPRKTVIGWAVPLWPMVLVCGIAGAALLIRHRPAGVCTACGYDLAALPLPIARCPECAAARPAAAA